MTYTTFSLSCSSDVLLHDQFTALTLYYFGLFDTFVYPVAMCSSPLTIGIHSSGFSVCFQHYLASLSH